MTDELRRARADLGVFAELVGRPMTDWQLGAFRLRARITAVVAPRQSGKSRSVGTLSAWWALRRPRQRVLIVSAGEDASRRLLTDVRGLITSHPLLRVSVAEEAVDRVALSNGSEIRSVPASEKAIRGWSTDLLIIDEAALVTDDIVLGAALPTTAARPDARIVLASSATAAAGSFYDMVQQGRQGAQHVEAFSWPLGKAHWISAATIEAARASMTEARFAAEYEGVFASAADAMFPRSLLERATAPVVVPGWPLPAWAVALHAGSDWGATVDRSAVVAVGRLQRPFGVWVIVAAHAWRSGHPLTGPGSVMEDLVSCPAGFERLSAECNGLGWPLAAELRRRRGGRVER
jgi:hypothetical protein